MFGPTPIDDWRLALAQLLDAALPHPPVAPLGEPAAATWPEGWEAL